jgi:hypothetical protein
MIKPTYFYNVNPNVIKGLTYWFCLRETYMVTLYLIQNLVVMKESYKKMGFYGLMLILPVIFIFGLPYSATKYKENVFENFGDDTSENYLPVFSKRNVRYLKVVARLSSSNLEIDEEI